MHMSYKKAVDNIEAYSYDSILEMDESELDSELTALDIDIGESLKSYMSVAENTDLLLKKAKLKQARFQLNNQSEIQSRTSQISSFLVQKGMDATDYLIQLVASGRATVAFRNGQELSDEEAINIINDLIELGEVDINE